MDLVYKGKLPIIIDENSLQEKKAALLELDCDSFSISALKSDRNLRFSDAVLAFLLKAGERDWRFHPKTVSVLQEAKRDHLCAWPESRRHVARRNSYPPIEQKPQVVKKDPVRYQCIICHVEWVHDFSHLRCPKCESHLYAREIS